MPGFGRTLIRVGSPAIHVISASVEFARAASGRTGNCLRIGAVPETRCSLPVGDAMPMTSVASASSQRRAEADVSVTPQRAAVLARGALSRQLKALAPLCCVLMCVAMSAEAGALRCDRKIVSIGDHAFDVRQHCGDPAARDSHVIYPYEQDPNDPARRAPVLDLPIVIDEWLYDFGATRFKQLLRFQNGRLIEVRRLDKGSYRH